MFRFTIRDVLLVMVIVGLAAGWWLEHRANLTLAHDAKRLAQMSAEPDCFSEAYRKTYELKYGAAPRRP